MKNKMIHELFQLSHAKTFEGDTLLSLHFQNDKKELALNSQSPTELHDLVKHGVFNAAAKSTSFIRASYIDKINLLFVGLGAKKDSSFETARQTGAVTFTKVSSEKVKVLGIDVDSFLKASGKEHAAEVLCAFLEGFYLASYTYDKHKTTPKHNHKLKSITLVSSDKKNDNWLNELAHKVLVTADCTFLTRDLSNEPSNFGTPEYYANTLAKLSKDYGLKCKIMNEAACKKENMNLFLSVGNGSTRESYVVVMEYTPKTGAKTAKTVSLVGKGVTFDSGGISIKPSMKMEDMKHDMTGAATMIGATLMAARLEAKQKIITVLGFCENMPGNNATQPGNVITTRNGKTVEIINTDAEGRLVLADILDLAQDYKPDVMVNTATLTGASTVALGKLASALFANDEKLAQQFIEVSCKTEERLWKLPLWDEYFDDLKTPYADMANSANDAAGGTIRGAIFLKQFIKEGQKWAHIDLANRAYDQGFLPYNPRKGSSGVYVRTFAEFVMNYR
jgi:leucyl aminopeptidase